jgi:glycine betaine catabolism B
MREYRLTLIEKIKRTKTIESFRFNSEETIRFAPGQFLQLIFDEKNRENRALNKYLSFSSSPTKSYIEVTKRLSASDFSLNLKALEAGDKILVKAPMGNCVLGQADKAITFLVGGIGITPAISIIEYIQDMKLPINVEVFYANRAEDDIAFRNELDLWQKLNNNIKVIYRVDCPTSDTSCMYGFIDSTLVCRESKCLQDRVFFVFGPPKMVEAMKAVCKDIGCAQDRIRTESFLGY